MSNEAIIEALLFSRAEPWDEAELLKHLKISNEELSTAITSLESSLLNRGICLVKSSGTITLGTNPEASELLKKIYKEELEKSLSKASVETLSIIMYGDEVTRGKIDYIRGVNSSFILRSLLVRGLIERTAYPYDKKRFMYVPTIDLLSFMGVTNVKDLKDYERINAELNKAGNEAEQNNDGNNTNDKEITS